METLERDETRGDSSIEVRLLGPLTIRRNDVALTLPGSRKTRALFAYLSLAPQAVPRSRLCELLWDVPSDPRGELRWCLSKIRGLIDDPGRRRVDARADAVKLDLSDCYVDVLELVRATAHIETLDRARLRTLAGSFAGDFLDGLELDDSPAFDGWLTAQRRRFRSAQVALLEHLAIGLRDDEAFEYLEAWLKLAPFDGRAHQLLLDALARHGRIREAEEHLAATSRLFDAEGLDYAPLHVAWRSAKTTRIIDAPGEGVAPVTRRASIAIMPFNDESPVSGPRGGAGDGFAHDAITRLAKLRSLFVIAQGSVFALRERSIGPQDAARMLDVDYVVSGAVRRESGRLAVMVELVETRTARVVWAETFHRTIDDTFVVLDEIGNQIVASIASEIETVETNRAVLLPPTSLDAWGAYHRGLWHAYRFNKLDNDRARHFFEMAVRLDPTFARAYSSLSFTHFQNAFQGWTERKPEIDRAFTTAGQSIMADDRDPAAHWAMGRALWLRGIHAQSLVELQQAVDLSPNFALGHYTLAFVQSQMGDPRAAILASDRSRNLSPFDPMLFAMLGARAMALIRLGRFDEAAEWALKATARPNAHAHISAIATYALALAGRPGEARACLAAIRIALPRYGVDDFLTAMQFDCEGEGLFRTAAKRID